MNYTTVWDSLCAYISSQFPEIEVHQQYAAITDLEELTTDDRPAVWVSMTSANIASVNTQADYVEDSFTFRLILAWKLRGTVNIPELNDKTNALQIFMSQFRHKGIKAGNVTIFFGLPTCDSPYDEDAIISPGMYVSTISVPVSVYRNLDFEPVTINGDNQREQSTNEAQGGEG